MFPRLFILLNGLSLVPQSFKSINFYLGTIRATIMIETLPAAVDIEEMIYELREYCCGANAGRWDYIFSIIKRLQNKPEAVLPDRKQVTIWEIGKQGHQCQKWF